MISSPDGSGKDNENDYDNDDIGIASLGVNTGQAYCTECGSWYDATTQSDAHAH